MHAAAAARAPQLQHRCACEVCEPLPQPLRASVSPNQCHTSTTVTLQTRQQLEADGDGEAQSLLMLTSSHSPEPFRAAVLAAKRSPAAGMAAAAEALLGSPAALGSSPLGDRTNHLGQVRWNLQPASTAA